MANEELADKILTLLGNNPAAYPDINDKWPVIFADLFFYSLPIIFGILITFPFFWIWHKKKKFTAKNIGKAALQAIGLVVLGFFALFLLMSYLQGLAFCELNGC